MVHDRPSIGVRDTCGETQRTFLMYDASRNLGGFPKSRLAA